MCAHPCACARLLPATQAAEVEGATPGGGRCLRPQVPVSPMRSGGSGPREAGATGGGGAPAEGSPRKKKSVRTLRDMVEMERDTEPHGDGEQCEGAE